MSLVNCAESQRAVRDGDIEWLSQSIPQGDKQEFVRSTGYDSSSSSPRPLVPSTPRLPSRLDQWRNNATSWPPPFVFRSIDRCSPRLYLTVVWFFPLLCLSFLSFFLSLFFRLCVFALFFLIRWYAQVARVRTGRVINPRLSEPIHRHRRCRIGGDKRLVAEWKPRCDWMTIDGTVTWYTLR